MTQDIAANRREHLRSIVEPYTYRLTGSDGQVREQDLLDDDATVGLSLIYGLANKEGRRVNLSGQGADEIVSDYSRWPEMSHFQGRFPDDLREWPNFAGNYQRAYLAKEEHIAGAHGIETRYPFLDREVVQEFLWLKAELKNRCYKAPIREYLARCDYPFRPDKKIGFRIMR